ncbi:MAG: carbohydrate ABC transporter permease [Kiritimatiellae bacterium]|jgi:ABC-type glycerol-3-phosphate transport system permease component|nr:carbohydrate ABC transporter permease [Kiritimatiellia bacterium]
MGLISKTGRRSPKTRFLLAMIFLLLSVGAVTMTVHFLLMLSGSTRSGVDLHEFSLWPRFLQDDELLFQKYIEGLYNESPANLRAAWEIDVSDFARLERLPEVDSDKVTRWREFISDQEIADHERFAGFTYCPISRGRPYTVRLFMKHVIERYPTGIQDMNTQLETSFPNWNAFNVLPPDSRTRHGLVADTPWWRTWHSFVAESAPFWTTGIHNLSGYYHERVTTVLEGRTAPRQPLTTTPVPDSPHWELFVREVVHPGFVRMDSRYADLWRELLRARYGDLDAFRDLTGWMVDSWQGVPLPTTLTEAGPLEADWLAFLLGWQEVEQDRLHRIPLEGLRLDSPDLRWRELTGESPPFRELDEWRFESHRSEIRRLFLFQHYGTVWEILIKHGRGLWVTVVYCASAVALALIVNPLAAYALSRFRPRHSYAFLLYLLLTMAFPPMVTQIPLFLMLRDLHLLNTFWALLLPGMAHGYSIFLLKGFFDSLPRELYESASLDGAGELLMFRVITLSLSKPILAVIALGAFVNAYTAFMFALLICQDERMWTRMVWLNHLQHQYGPGVMNAAFVLAALPTLFVFLIAQRQILRGIVVPSEK